MITTKTIEVTEAYCDFCGKDIDGVELANLPTYEGRRMHYSVVIDRYTVTGDREWTPIANLRLSVNGIMCADCAKTVRRWLEYNKV